MKKESFVSALDANGLSLYIHVPFCLQKCHYCDFYSTPTVLSDSLLEAYLSTLEMELRIRAPRDPSDFAIRSIYFGGGTPSLLPPTAIVRILLAIKMTFPSIQDFSTIEVTLEANPEHITPEFLSRMKEAGVNRLQVGIQTFQKRHLNEFHRYFNEDRYNQVLSLLTSQRDFRFGADLMYGFPGQSEKEFLEDLELLVDAKASHISLYSLTLEKNTPYQRMVSSGALLSPDEALQEKLFQELPDRMSARGYEWYEISNYSAGKENRSLHNLSYWLYMPYLALGPSAHGFDGTYRYENATEIQSWIDDTGKGVSRSFKHKPGLELPLSFFRITAWFSRTDLKRAMNRAFGDRENLDPGELMSTLAGEGLFDRVLSPGGEPLYRWNGPAVLMLDDHMARIADWFLERIPGGGP